MFVISMLTRTEERTGHSAAIYALRTAPDGFYSAAADGLLVHWHKYDVNFGRAVANVEGGKIHCGASCTKPLRISCSLAPAMASFIPSGEKIFNSKGLPSQTTHRCLPSPSPTGRTLM